MRHERVIKHGDGTMHEAIGTWIWQNIYDCQTNTVFNRDYKVRPEEILVITFTRAASRER